MEILRRFGWYLLYTAFIGFILGLGIYYNNALSVSGLPYMIFSMVWPLVFGVCLALPRLIKYIRQSGRWYYDWVKLLAIGLPALYIALFQAFYFFFHLTGWLPSRVQVLLISSTFSQMAAGLVFGYVLISSLEKRM